MTWHHNIKVNLVTATLPSVTSNIPLDAEQNLILTRDIGNTQDMTWAPAEPQCLAVVLFLS